jgi:hypothetical protein
MKYHVKCVDQFVYRFRIPVLKYCANEVFVPLQQFPVTENEMRGAYSTHGKDECIKNVVGKGRRRWADNIKNGF